MTAVVPPAYIGYSNYQNEGINQLTSSLSSTSASLTAQIAKQAQDVLDLYASDNFNKSFLMERINDEATTARSAEAVIRNNVLNNTEAIASHTSQINTLISGLSAQVQKELTDVAFLESVDLMIKNQVNILVNADNGIKSQIYDKASMNNLYALSGAMASFVQLFSGTYSIVRQSDGATLTASQLFNPVFTPNAPATSSPVPFPVA
jgi:hypothetical protein